MGIKARIKKKIANILNVAPQYVEARISYLTPNERLLGKKIVITGGSRGLGLAMAKKSVAEGAKVLITGRSEESLKKTAEGIGCEYMVLDVKNVNVFDSFVNEAAKRLKGLDSIICNAGVSLHEGGFMNVTPQTFNCQFDTNLRGGYFLAQSFIKYILENKVPSANILFISSEKGIFVDDMPYGLTKRALISLTQALANEYIQKGIRINAIAPGVTASDMTGYKADSNLYAPFQINRRIYLPEEVAEVAVFLLSDASRCLSGQILACNEGKSINRPLEISVF